MSSRAWKDLEKATAEALGGRRVHRRWDLFERAPDVIVADHNLICECKYRTRWAHHGLIEQAQAKYCLGGERIALVTKAHGQQGAYATVPLDFLAAILAKAKP